MTLHRPATEAAATEALAVGVVVLNWNGLADTCDAVDSLLLQTWPRLTVHVVDNASSGDDADQLESRFGERIQLHRNAANLGFAGGHNDLLHRLLADGKTRYIALLNNDAVAQPTWVAELVAVAERSTDVGAVASLMVFKTRPDIVENAGVSVLRTGEAVPRGRGRRAVEYVREVDLLGACGGAVLLRVAALRQVGVFRDEFFLNFEDVDLCLRLVATGWRCRLAPRALVRHGLSQSIDKVRDEAFSVRSIRNMGFAYLVNMPLGVVLMGLPWLFVGWVLAPLACLAVLQFGYARILVRGRLVTLREARTLLAARRSLRCQRRGSWWRIWRMHGSSFAAYGRFLRDVVWAKRRRALQ